MWWDILGWSQTFEIPILSKGIDDLFGSTESVRDFKLRCCSIQTLILFQFHLLELLSTFLTEQQAEHSQLTICAEPNTYNIWKKSLTMSRYVAAVFREGRINLEPDWNTERLSNEDLKSACRVSAKSPLIVEHLAN